MDNLTWDQDKVTKKLSKPQLSNGEQNLNMNSEIIRFRMISPIIKNYIAGIMSVISGAIDIVFFMAFIAFFGPEALWVFSFLFFIPGIVGLLPILLLRFDIPLERRAFISIICFFVSSIPLVYLAYISIFLRRGIAITINPLGFIFSI